MLEPFDYVELATGELVCVMWRYQGQGYESVGYVIYVPFAGGRLGPTRYLGGRKYEKLYWCKNKAAHDYYVRKQPLRAAEDRIGGLMVRVQVKDVKRVLPCRGVIGAICKEGLPIGVERALSFLRVDPETAGLTGSSLLDRDITGRDLDVVLYDCNVARTAARDVRRFVAANPAARLPGHWGRAWHHRRFRVEGVEVCPKVPLPQEVVAALPRAERWRRLDGGGVVVNAEYGHCMPAVYEVEVAGSAGSGRLRVLSAESAHCMAFLPGDWVQLNGVRLWVSSRERFGAISMGKPNALRPAADRSVARDAPVRSLRAVPRGPAMELTGIPVDLRQIGGSRFIRHARIPGG